MLRSGSLQYPDCKICMQQQSCEQLCMQSCAAAHSFSHASLSSSSSVHNVYNKLDSTSVTVDPSFLRNPGKKGLIYNAAAARSYIKGERDTVCLVKWPRLSHDCKFKDHLEQTIIMSKKAARIVSNFLQESSVNTKGWFVKVNIPTIINCSDCCSFGKYVKALAEPYINHFEKFNSPDGPSYNSRNWHNKIVQAISHYSYYISDGNTLLCGLKGGVNEKEKLITLSNPVIISREGLKYSCEDGGERAIYRFFRNHKCNEICRKLPVPVATSRHKVVFRPI